MPAAVPASLLDPAAFAPARLFTLGNAAGLRLRVLDRGATLLSCSLPLPDGSRRELLLGCASLADYQRQGAYLGATVGRYANRIARAQFELDGQTVQLQPNEGPNQLHGGPDGFDKRTWQVEAQSDQALVLTLTSPDGDQGFPGELQARVSYLLGDDLSLEIRFEATTSRACPVNLTHHAYFNLDGEAGADTGSCLRHTLQVASKDWWPVDGGLIPLGASTPVAGSGFDLRTPRQLAEAIASDAVLQASHGFDHCLRLDTACANLSTPAAELVSADGRVRMLLATDQPALQVYSGQGLAGTPARDGGEYRAHAGIALEPQFAPDSPNHATSEDWPDCVLRPGQRYLRRSVLRFMTR